MCSPHLRHDSTEMNATRITQPESARAYAALARRIAAIDMAIKCKDLTDVQDLIRDEVKAAMEVIHQYEYTSFFIAQDDVRTKAFAYAVFNEQRIQQKQKQ